MLREKNRQILVQVLPRKKKNLYILFGILGMGDKFEMKILKETQAVILEGKSVSLT